MLIKGRCHCANILVELEWAGDPREMPARACGCSFCVRHGAVWTSDPHSHVAVTLEDPALVSKYGFGTGTAVFHVCARCGAVPLVTSEIEDHVYAVVNVNVLDDIDARSLRRTATSFDGEDVESRLARRKRGWIADVRFSERGASIDAGPDAS